METHYLKPMPVLPQPQQEPEMLRVPLESVIMTVKAIFGPSAPAQAVLGRAITPPEPAACSCAVAALKVRARVVNSSVWGGGGGHEEVLDKGVKTRGH